MNRPAPGLLDTLDPESWHRGRSQLTSTRDQQLGRQGFHLPDHDQAVVHAALTLGEPLLVTGEPGTGKTTLAHYLAHKLGTALFEFHTQSISVARDLRYRYDELRRFREAWRTREGAPGADVSAEDYLEPGPLWRAIEHANQTGRPPVLLIDEIDKAPRDLPNDLLHDLDQMSFVVPELGNRKVELSRDRLDARPVVIITSNEERELPKPFLRRCVFLRTRLDEALVRAALQARASELGNPAPEFLDLVVKRVWEVRRAAARKPPATAEALMWTRALRRYNHTAADLPEGEPGRWPFAELLVKHPTDRKQVLGRD